MSKNLQVKLLNIVFFEEFGLICLSKVTFFVKLKVVRFLVEQKILVGTILWEKS